MALRAGNPPSEEVVSKGEEAFEFLEKFLEGQDWVAGSNITIADFAIIISVSLTEVSLLVFLSLILVTNIMVHLSSALK